MRTAIIVVALTMCAVALADDRDEAKHHFMEAEKQFQLGHYADAAKEYEAGYSLFPRPGFLWDIAQSYRKLGDTEKALHFYKQYVLNAAPSTKTAVNVPEAQEQIRLLEPLVAAQQKARSAPPDGVVGADAVKEPASVPIVQPSNAAAPEAALAPPSVTSPASAAGQGWYRSPLAIAGLSLLGASLVAGGVGAGLLVHGNDLDAQLSSASSIPQADALASSRDTYRNTSYAIFAVAGASAAVAAALIGVSAARRHRHAQSFAATLAPGGGILLAVGGSL